MTKEALEKQAIKYAVDYPTSYGKGYKRKDLRIAYLAGHKAGFEDCAKARLNVTTISDCPIRDDELTKAKEIIQKMLRDIPNRMWYSDETIKQAEQFLKDNLKDNEVEEWQQRQRITYFIL